MAKLPPAYFNHSHKVCALYKKALRSISDYYIDDVPECRYQSVLMRERFEKNKNIKDPRKAKMLLMQGEEEVFQKAHYDPIKFITSPGGLAYYRDATISDEFLDYWDPWEKAQYPKYFALREQRKKDYIEFYKKEYLSGSSDAQKNNDAK